MISAEEAIKRLKVGMAVFRWYWNLHHDKSEDPLA